MKTITAALDDRLADLRQELGNYEADLDVLRDRIARIEGEIEGLESARQIAIALGTTAFPPPADLPRVYTKKPCGPNLEDRVIKALSPAGSWATPKTLIEVLGVSRPSLSRCLRRMAERGQLVKTHGKYGLPQ